MLSCATQLKEFHLEGNDLQSASASEIAKALQHTTTLTARGSIFLTIT